LLETAVRRHAQLVLDRAGGDRAAAAKLLGIGEKELDGHLDAEPIDPSQAGG
jgi:hypothetical protein